MEQLVFIGAGRVAVNLSLALTARGFRVNQVCNRSEEKGVRLANQLNAGYIPDPAMIDTGAGMIIIAVADDAIPEVCRQMGRRDAIVVHTSGSQHLNVLKDASGHHGVLYPLQTFGGNAPVDFREVPVFLEASDENALQTITMVARTISDRVLEMDSARRARVHLAAVFANNFSSFMFTVAEELITEAGADPHLLLPLIHRTCQNLPERDIFTRQTGPAVRNDFQIISRHSGMLHDHPDYREIYDLITQKIIKYKISHG